MYFDASKMKTSFEKRFFKWNRILLLAAGIWPYQQSKFVQFQVAFFLGILISFVAVQMQYILEQLQYIYDNLRDNNEIVIYDKYGNTAKRMTIAFIIAEVYCLLFGTIVLIGPDIVHVIQSNNATYTNNARAIVCKHFAIQEKYFYVILLHFVTVVIIGSSAAVAVGTMVFSYIMHIWGLFRIASYHLEQAMWSNVLQNSSLINNEIVIYQEIVYAVNVHRKAMNFATVLMKCMEKSLFCNIISTVVCASCNLYRVCRLKAFAEEMEETVLNFVVVIFVFIYMFVLNYAGQEITDYNNDIFFTAYNIPWYLAPLHIQKLILFVLQKGSKAFTITICGIFTMSLDCFTSLTSTTLSYLTVMLSVKE